MLELVSSFTSIQSLPEEDSKENTSQLGTHEDIEEHHKIQSLVSSLSL